jgi:hypothetical protein
MTQEKFEELKNDYIENLEHFISESGGLFPHLTLFGTSKSDNKASIIHFPIPDEYMKNNGTKDELVINVIPKLAKEISKDFSIIAMAWASEAWMRVLEKDEKMPEDYTSIPIKKEVVMISIEDEKGVKNIIYDIHRGGKQVTEDGDLVDSIKLEKSEQLSDVVSQGRFVGLLKHFTNKHSVVDDLLNKIISKEK